MVAPRGTVELRFTPKDDWPVDGSFDVRFARNGLFGDGIVLEDATHALVVDADFPSGRGVIRVDRKYNIRHATA